MICCPAPGPEVMEVHLPFSRQCGCAGLSGCERQGLRIVDGNALDGNDVGVCKFDGLKVPVAAEVLSKDRVVGFADLAFDILELFGKGESKHGEHTVERVVEIGYKGEEVASIEVVPVFEVWHRFQEICGQGETDGSNVLDANHALENAHERLEFARVALVLIGSCAKLLLISHLDCFRRGGDLVCGGILVGCRHDGLCG